MKKCLYVTGMLGCALALRAETPVVMHAPFAFVAAGKTLPAGDYQLEMLTQGALRIAGPGSADRVLVLVNVSEGSTRPAVEFDSSGSTPVLTRVSSSVGTWTLMGASPSRVAAAILNRAQR